MASCPSCGSEVKQVDKFCNSCGGALQNKPGVDVKWQDPEDESEQKGKEETSDDNNGGANSDEKRQKWLQQQKAFQNEISGLKTDLKDEIEKKPDQIDLPFPSPYQRYYPQHTDFDIGGKNYSPYNIDVVGERNVDLPTRTSPPDNKTKADKDTGAPSETSEGDESKASGQEHESDRSVSVPEEKGNSAGNSEKVSNKTQTLDGPAKSPSKPPKEIKVKANDLLRVDTILSDMDTEVDPRNSNISGAIDQILSHEKGHKTTDKTKVMKMKLSTPSLKSSPSKKHEAEELINAIENSIRKTPSDFNSKPIEKILINSKNKITEMDYDEAFDIALSAKKALKRFGEYHTTSKARMKELEHNYPFIKDPDHSLFKDYQRLRSFMADGQYHKAAQKLPQLKVKLEQKFNAVPAVRAGPEASGKKVQEAIPAPVQGRSEGTANAIGQRSGAGSPPAARAKVPPTQRGPGIDTRPNTSAKGPEQDDYQNKKMPKWMRKKGRRKKKKNR